MSNSLRRLTIAGSVGGLVLLFSVFATNGAPQPAGLAVVGQAECDCSHLKALQVELRNALLLQQAMRNKIPELRVLDHTKSLTEYKRFAENDARRGLELIPNYDKLSKADQDALSQFNFDVKGFALSDPTHPPLNSKEWTPAKLCSLTPDAESALTKVKSLAACTGIAAAIQAHEDVHTHSCLLGFVAFFNRNGADRAQEEVEAYDAQIKVLREIIAHLRCGYRATGQDGPVVYSGVICSLEEPFTVTGTHPLFIFSFKFVPSSATSGMMTYATSGSGISAAGGGPYAIEGTDTETPRIRVNTQSTASSRAATTSGGGMATIKLVRLETGECQASQPR
jgi:hypothetical protein